jgi:membrane protein
MQPAGRHGVLPGWLSLRTATRRGTIGARMDAVTQAPPVPPRRIRWVRLMRRTAEEAITDRVSLAAAGCAFYATLALFPAISMVVATYGLMFDIGTVAPQLNYLRLLLPPEAFALIAGRVRWLVSQPPGTLTVNLLISTVVALWSSATGTKSILGALNLAYDLREQRSFLRFQGTAFLLTLGGILAATAGIALMVLVPAAEALLGLHVANGLPASLSGRLLLAGIVLLSICLLYRFGPSRPRAPWRRVWPGAAAATCVWLAASALFSWYVGHLASYDTTYGPLGAVVGLMMWFYVSAFCVLAGAEFNAAYEREIAGAAGACAVPPARSMG